MTDRKHAIDLTRHQFHRHMGELSLYGTWLWNEDQEAYEPALVVINALNPRRFRPCVVALSAAYKYNHPVYMAHAAREFVTLLGLQDNMTMAYKVATLIEDHLGDLLKMPPNPETQIVVADATIGSGIGRRSIEIVDYVPTPQA